MMKEVRLPHSGVQKHGSLVSIPAAMLYLVIAVMLLATTQVSAQTPCSPHLGANPQWKTGMVITPGPFDNPAGYPSTLTWQQELQIAAQGNVNTVWFIVPWNLVESYSSMGDTYNWTALSNDVNAAIACGFRVAIRLEIVTNSVATGGTPVNWFPSGLPTDFTNSTFQNDLIAFIKSYSTEFAGRVNITTLGGGLNGYFDMLETKSGGGGYPYAQAQFNAFLPLVGQIAYWVYNPPGGSQGLQSTFALDLDLAPVYAITYNVTPVQWPNDIVHYTDPLIANGYFNYIGWAVYPTDTARYGAYPGNNGGQPLLDNITTLMHNMTPNNQVWITEIGVPSTPSNSNQDYWTAQQGQMGVIIEFMPVFAQDSQILGWDWFTLFDGNPCNGTNAIDNTNMGFFTFYNNSDWWNFNATNPQLSAPVCPPPADASAYPEAKPAWNYWAELNSEAELTATPPQ